MSISEEKIETTWPSGAFPRRLACATDGANVMLAAASRFGLFQAELQQRTGGVAQFFRLCTIMEPNSNGLLVAMPFVPSSVLAPSSVKKKGC